MFSHEGPTTSLHLLVSAPYYHVNSTTQVQCKIITEGFFLQHFYYVLKKGSYSPYPQETKTLSRLLQQFQSVLPWHIGSALKCYFARHMIRPLCTSIGFVHKSEPFFRPTPVHMSLFRFAVGSTTHRPPQTAHRRAGRTRPSCPRWRCTTDLVGQGTTSGRGDPLPPPSGEPVETPADKVGPVAMLIGWLRLVMVGVWGNHLHQVEGYRRLRHGDLEHWLISRCSGAQVDQVQIAAWYGGFLL